MEQEYPSIYSVEYTKRETRYLKNFTQPQLGWESASKWNFNIDTLPFVVESLFNKFENEIEELTETTVESFVKNLKRKSYGDIKLKSGDILIVVLKEHTCLPKFTINNYSQYARENEEYYDECYLMNDYSPRVFTVNSINETHIKEMLKRPDDRITYNKVDFSYVLQTLLTVGDVKVYSDIENFVNSFTIEETFQ